MALLDRWPSLRSRPFRIFLAGHFVSLIGTFMQAAAIGWLVFRLKHSTFALGLVPLATEIPGLVATSFGGTFVDRHDPRRVLLITQTLAMLQAIALGVLVALDRISLGWVLALGAVMGAINGFDNPARQVLVPRLITEPKAVKTAVSAVSMTMDGARLVGPAVGGFLIHHTREDVCFFVNAASYLGMLGVLWTLQLAVSTSRQRPPFWSGLVAGFRHAAHSPPMRRVLLLVGAVAFGSAAHTALLPYMSGQVLEGGSKTLGVFLACPGIGAIGGAFFLGSRWAPWRLERTVVAGSFLFGAAIVAFAVVRSFWPSIPILALGGFGVMIFMASSNTILLTVSDESKRGRVMSLFSASLMTAFPIGSFLAGSLATRLGAPSTVAIGGLLCVGSSLVFALTQPPDIARAAASHPNEKSGVA